MDSDIIEEVVVGLVEVGADVADTKKPGCGCLILILFVLIIGTIMYFSSETNSTEIKKENIIKQ